MKAKRFLSILLILSILFCLCLPSYAVEEHTASIDTEVQNQMLRILASVEPEKENYGLENVNFSSVEIGNELAAYKVKNGQLVNADIKLIPLLLDEELVSLFYVANLPNGEVYVQLSNELVPSIATYSDANSLAIVYDDIGAYVYTENSLHFLGNREQLAYSNEDTYRHNAQFPSQISYLNNDSLDDNSNNLVSCLTENELCTIKTSPFAIGMNLNVENFVEFLPSAYAATSATLPVEIIKQPANTSICWAITVTSIANYVFNARDTYEGIVMLFNGGYDRGMYIEDVFYRFNDVFHTIWLYQYTTTIAPDTALTYLNAGYPLYGDFTRTGGAHAVVIRGVNTTVRTFSIMNPTPVTSGYTAGTISSNNVWTFISGYSGSLYTLRAYGFPGKI